MSANECLVCKSKPVFYGSPTGHKVLACCSNGGCRTRHKPPVAGSDSFGALAMWNLTFGGLS